MEKKPKKLMSLSKKNLPLLFVLFLIGVLLLTLSNFIPGDRQDTNSVSEVSSQGQKESALETGNTGSADSLTEVETAIENQLEDILTTVEGVGNVSVRVTLENGPQYIYATDENLNESKVEEKDSNGSQRVTTESTNSDQMVMAQPASMGGQQPVVEKEIKPKVAGVLVTAEGARDADIKVTLSRAVQTLLDLPAHKVSILPKDVE